MLVPLECDEAVGPSGEHVIRWATAIESGYRAGLLHTEHEGWQWWIELQGEDGEDKRFCPDSDVPDWARDKLAACAQVSV